MSYHETENSAASDSALPPQGRAGRVLVPSCAWHSVTLVILTVAVYSQLFAAHFVRWDDDLHVYANPYLNPPTLASIRVFWERPYEGLYVPLAYMFFAAIAHFAQAAPALDRYVGDVIAVSPAPFHAVNLCLHASNAVLAFLLLRRLVRMEAAAFAGALLFAIHPLQVESVAWISELRGQTSSLLSLLALICFTQYRRWPGGRSRWGWFSLTLGLTVMAGLCKPTAVVLPLAALAVDRIVLNTPWKRSMALFIPWAAVAIPFGLITRGVQHLPPEVITPLWKRPFIAGDALSFYIGKLIAPLGLIIHYGRTPSELFTHPWAYATWLMPAILLALSYRAGRTRPNIWLGALLFVIFLLPELGLVPFGFQHMSTVADRYVYLSMLGIGLIAAELLSRMPQRSAIGAAAVAAVPLAYLTWTQCGFWFDTGRLMTRCLAVNPASAVAYTNRGMLELGNGLFAESVADFQLAISSSTDNFQALVDLGKVYVTTGQYGLAKQTLIEATHVNSNNADAECDLGVALMTMGDLKGADEAFQRSARIAPNNPVELYNYGLFLASVNRVDESIACYRRVLELTPSFPKAHMGLAINLFKIGMVNDSIAEFRETLRLSPNEPGAAQDLAMAQNSSQHGLHL